MTHDLIDRRSLEFDTLIVRRVREHPALAAEAKAILGRWLLTCASGVKPALLEWQEALDGDFEELLALLTSHDERATRMRQSSPFVGEKFITRTERNEILRRFRHE